MDTADRIPLLNANVALEHIGSLHAVINTAFLAVSGVDDTVLDL